MSFVKIYKSDWKYLKDNQKFPTKGSLYVGYDLSGSYYPSDILLQMDDVGNITPIGTSGSTSGSTLGIIYINEEQVPEKIGGILPGDSFPDPGFSMKEMWDKLLYPYMSPYFSLFNLSLGSTGSTIGDNLEIGNNFSTGIFNWSTTYPTNVKINSIGIYGDHLNTLTGLSNDGNENVTFSSLVTRTSSDGPGTKNWTISGKNTKDNNMTYRNFSIRWDWKFYWGTSSNISLNETQIKSLTYSGLYSTYLRLYSFTSGEYKYLCYADIYGGASNFVDEFTGFGVSMYGGYSNSENGYTYDLVSVTNDFSQTTNYRVYRTTHKITSDINIIVS